MKYRVVLNEEEQKELQSIVRRGKHSARKIRRARSLLHSHQGMSATRIAELLDVHPNSVYRSRRLFVTDGLDAALEERPRSGQPRRLDGRGEATLIALACSSPPEFETSNSPSSTATVVAPSGATEMIASLPRIAIAAVGVMICILA